MNPSANRSVPAMTCTRSIALAAVLCFGSLVASGASAASKQDACAALTDSRVALYSMLTVKEKNALDELGAKVKQSSAKLDAVLAAMSGADAKAAAEFKPVWDEFKSTRDREIIPALYAGKDGEARRLADGIQLDRLSKMWGIMSCR